MRGRDSSIAEGIVIIASKLPWWMSLILAALSFLILHSIAGITPEPMTGPGTMGTFAVKQLWITLAWLGQIALPTLLVMAGIYSGIKKDRR